MENIKDKILKFLRLDGVINNLSGYIESRVALAKIEIREEVAVILSKGLMIMLIILVGFLFTLFVGFAAAQYLNAIMMSGYAGYVIVSLIFGFLLILMILFRKSFFRMFEKQFIELIRHRQE